MENFAFTFDNLRKPFGDNEPYHTLKLLQLTHFASLNTHIFAALGSNAISRP
jgi:hypothetical protein